MISSNAARISQSPVRVNGVGIGQDYYNEEADAAERDEYYSGVQDVLETGSGEEMYQSLNRLLKKTHRDLGYKQARRHLYKTIDRRPDGALYYLYSGEGPKNEEEVKGPVNRHLGNYNCEHVVPQSWFNKRHPMKADLHHLFTEEIPCNSSRGNYNLTELDNAETLPQCGLVDHRGREFEPNAGKGAVARATMYFLVRHPGYVGDANVETKPEDLQQLLKWHHEYPVSDYERHRNETIQDVQGNRNPFIDYPDLADKVNFAGGFAS